MIVVNVFSLNKTILNLRLSLKKDYVLVKSYQNLHVERFL